MRLKHLVPAILSAVLALSGAVRAIEVSGTIITTLWTAESSPYRVTGTITVPAGGTLTIGPGVDVLFDADAQFIVQGRLEAIGTESDSIRFLRGTAPDWRGIRIIGGDSSSIAYARISGGNARGVWPDNCGGGLYLNDAGTRVGVVNSLISGNTAYVGGGVFAHVGAVLVMEGVVISDNSTASDGAGVYNYLSTMALTKCTFYGNTAIGGGSAAMNNSGTLTMTNCTVFGNSATSNGGAVYNVAALTMANSIVSGNAGGQIAGDGSFAVTYSDIEQAVGTFDGMGNINADPLFVNATARDFHLQSGSPCIDTGNPANLLDPDGTTADMGAFTYFHVLVISENTTWYRADGPFRVGAMVTVASGATLTIEPGVDVLFDKDVQFVINGVLNAVGTSADSIRFLTGNASYWRGIRISGGDSSSMAYTRMSGGNARGVWPDDSGGALFLTGRNTRLNLDNCVVSRNTAEEAGALRVEDYARATLNNCAFHGNSALQGAGGAMSFTYKTRATLVGCVISGNSAASGGGAMYARFAEAVTLNGCTVSGNSATTNGSAFYVDRKTTVIINNSILYEYGGTHPIKAIGDVVMTYSDIEFGYAGIGNIDADPLFVNAADGDYRLMIGSPCIDTGDPASPLDSDGSRADMGAFPRGQAFPSELALPVVATYAGNWVEGVVTGTIGAAVGVDLAFLVDTSVVDSVQVVDSPYSHREVNTYGDTVFVGLSNVTAPAIGGGEIARLRFKLKPTAHPYESYLSFVGYPETAVDEQPALLTDGSVQVLNRPPVWSARADTAADPLVPLVFTVEATDADGHGLVYEMLDHPLSAQFQTSTRTFSWQPAFQQAGDTLVVFRVTDGYDAVNDTVSISVWDYYGDVTLNGDITALDASKALQYSVRLITEITVEVADVSDNGTVSAFDAGLILHKLIDSGFVFPVRTVNMKTKTAHTAPRSLAFVRAGDDWNLVVSDPDGIIGCDLTLSLPENANVAFSGDGAVEFTVDGQTALVGIARAEFDNPVLLHVTGALPVIQAAALNEGMIPSVLSAPVPFSLSQNTPNPFNPVTTLRFGLPEAGHVTLAVYDVRGALVRTLVDRPLTDGLHEVVWDGCDSNGRAAASGVYVARLAAPQGVVTRRLTLLR